MGLSIAALIEDYERKLAACVKTSRVCLNLLHDRSEDELPLMHQQMWYGQTLCLHYLIAEDGNVQIDVARALVDKLDASVALLDSLQAVEKLDRCE